IVGPHEVEVRFLRRRARTGDFARRGLDRGRAEFLGRVLIAHLRGKTDFSVHVGGTDVVARFEPRIERAQRGRRRSARVCRALDGEEIAARRDAHAELLFQPHQMAAMRTGERRHQRVAFECERDLLMRARLVGPLAARGQFANTFSRVDANSPLRLLEWTSAMRTSWISPIISSAPSTCTGCRYGLRPTAWSRFVPGLSNRTGIVVATQERLNRAWLSPSTACRRVKRSRFTASGTCLAIAAPGVPGRGLYLNEKACA